MSALATPSAVVVHTPVGNVEVRREVWRNNAGQRRRRWHVRPVGLPEWTAHQLLRIAVALAFGYVEPPLPEWIDRVAEQARTQIGAA